MRKHSFYIVNGITFYRVIAAPILLLLIITRQPDIFKWLLIASFSTDAIDGFLARKYKVASKFGAAFDSIGDDLTVAAAVIGMIVLKPEFFRQELAPFIFLLILYI